MWFLGVAQAGNLGWAQMITNVSTEVRAVGIGGVIIAMIVMGIEIIMHRHLDRMGQAMAAVGVGSGLIAAAPTAAQTLLGGAAGAPLVGSVPVNLFTLGDLAGVSLYYGLSLITAGMLWLELRRGLHRGQ